jgi:hypothetical protein
VVAKLAARHGVEVKLRRSAYGGITAIVLIPEVLISGRLPGVPAEPPPSVLPLPPVALSLAGPLVPMPPPAGLMTEPDTVAFPLPGALTVPAVVMRTPSGLPVRARTGRDTSMAAVQRGTQRGRDAAAGLAGPISPAGPVPPAGFVPPAAFNGVPEDTTEDGAGNASDR